MKRATKSIVFSGLFLAVALLLPFLTGQIPQIGKALCPMHIPILICGFVCGWPYGLAVGFCAPILRFVLFGMPPIYPTGLAMAFELAAYGAAAGLLNKNRTKTMANLYMTLIVAMLIGRAVWGVVSAVLNSFAGTPFTLGIFISGAFLNAIPGIVLQLMIIPLIVRSLQHTWGGENKAFV